MRSLDIREAEVRYTPSISAERAQLCRCAAMQTAKFISYSLARFSLQFQPVSMGFASFFCALSGYFLLLPLRDEAGVSLGTDKLPRLFVASLFLTFLATPLATAFLHRSESRERGLQLLLRALGLSILGEEHTRCGSHCPAASMAVCVVRCVSCTCLLLQPSCSSTWRSATQSQQHTSTATHTHCQPAWQHCQQMIHKQQQSSSARTGGSCWRRWARCS
jgi:hypothetical protein